MGKSKEILEDPRKALEIPGNPRKSQEIFVNRDKRASDDLGEGKLGYGRAEAGLPLGAAQT